MKNSLIDRINQLNKIGVALSSEKKLETLLELILIGTKELTNADGGSLYLINEDNELVFEIMRTDSLNFAMGGTTGKAITYKPISLYDSQGKPRNDMVVTYAVLNNTTVNIKDAYDTKDFDFSGTQEFDKKTGYHSKSFLTVPMKDHKNETIGVLQLLNAQTEDTHEIIAFSDEDQQLVESLASQAAVAINNRRLIIEMHNLFESFIHMIAVAIDEKSPYTGGHCKRVPALTMMLAKAADTDESETFKQFKLTEEQQYELKIAAWLHDCGKVTTPEYVIDKSTKLETIFDRIHLINTRFQALKNELEVEFLKQKINLLEAGEKDKLQALEQQFHEHCQQLDDDRQFLETANIGGEYMKKTYQDRVHTISEYQWTNPDGEKTDFLDDDELYNLLIPRGTLSPEEREIINNHIVMTIKMLESLPFPKHLQNVPEYAGGHHETMDGTGYPNRLTRDQMSWQARMMAIADIFEALTAGDRPYKKAKTLSEALFILGKMKLQHHIDPELFDLFIREKVYLHYGKEYLDQKQIDDVDHSKIPGYTP